MSSTIHNDTNSPHAIRVSSAEEALLLRLIDSQPVSSIRDVGLYYWKPGDAKGNLGDELSPYIVRKLSGKEPKYASIDSPRKICAIGSIIEARTLRSGGIFWGTGTHHAELPDNNNRAVLSFRAVRGPITRNLLIRHGYRCPAIYGDPALLMPEFYTPAMPKKYKLGIIPHYAHQEHLNYCDDVKYIDIKRNRNEIERFIDEMCECEAILSSSLHGVILAHAYGIPARYFQVHGVPLAGSEGLKFADYFKSVKIPVQKPLIVVSGTTISHAFIKEINVTVDLKIDLDLLRDVFPY